MKDDEHKLQVALFAFLKVALRKECYAFAIPNGGLRNISVARKLKAEGVQAGVPDVGVMMPMGRIVWLELKAKGGRLSREQKQFRDLCDKITHQYCVIHSIDDAHYFLKNVGALKPGVELC
jgi:hypothetical protein